MFGETSPTSMRCIAALWRGKEGAFTLNTGELVFGIEPTTKHRCIPPLKRGVLAFGALINSAEWMTLMKD
jgi:hypothetical protein